jgi:hypothetical protein
VIAAGSALTVTLAVEIQPVGNEYVTVDVPATIPVTTPVAAFTGATVTLLLLHVPPVVALLNAVVKPTQTLSVPLIAAGNPLTVTTAFMVQPVGNVYTIVAVPTAAPVTTPVALTGATDALLLLHVPPAVALLSAVVEPTHTWRMPFTTAGNWLTVTTAVL